MRTNRNLIVRPLICLAILSGAFDVGRSPGGEIGFIEDFALAPDRAVVLKQLVPGAESYYYLYSLYHQQNEQFDKVDELLAAWRQRYGETQLFREIRTRQALLTYAKSPDKSLAYLRERLQLPLNHQRQQLDAEPAFPTRLDPALIARQTLVDRTLKQADDHLNGFENSALEGLADRELTPLQRRNLLGRLTWPDYPRLARLIADDLAQPNSGGFGSLGIHKQLLRGQLDELAQLRPQLLNEQAFVLAYLKRLEPTNDEDWRADPAILQSYLDRLHAFAQRLAPVNNSLKALVLFHQLQLDRSRGTYDKPRLLAYLKLPRPVVYLSKAMRESDELRRFPADPSQAHGTLLPAVGDDQELVRGCLAHFLLDAADTKEFEPFVDDVYLRHLFAEVKILAGVGSDEQWASLLPPDKFRALRDRVDIDFAHTNPRRFGVNDPVRLDVQLKNVGTLIVRVFEINTGNYYRARLSEITTDIELDGLVANSEQTIKLDGSPLRRTSRRFDFPQLAKPGVYVVDFIGNGRSSRALIRKGRLTSVSRVSSAGHVFTVLDDRNQLVKGARIWLAGQDYEAGENGKIVVPFTATPGEQPIVLSAPVEGGELSALDRFEHVSEDYQLTAGFHVDRESLLTRKTAQLVIRPMLSIHGEPVSIKALEDVRLVMTSVDLDGVPSRQEVRDVRLFEDRETTHEFQTPPRLATLQVVLTAQVKRLSGGGEKVSLTARHSVNVNSIDRTEKIEDLHLVPTSTGYFVELRGKTGEPKPSRPVHLQLKHGDVVEPLRVTLKTDPAGRVELGTLDGITSVRATGPENTSHTWFLPRGRHAWPRVIQGREGDAIQLPYLPRNPAAPLGRDEVSLLETRNGTFVADRFEHLSVRNGVLVLDKLPAGDFDLLLKSHQSRITVRIGRGEAVSGYVAGPIRQMETRSLAPPQIESITRAADKAAGKPDGNKPIAERLVIQVRNASPMTRVHLFATRFLPQFDAFESFAAVRDQELASFKRLDPSSLYVTGRNIGDEYRYILDRRYSTKYPGNSLERPALLLNPWALRDTRSGWQELVRGERHEQMADPAGVERAKSSERGVPTGTATEDVTSNLDFLPLGSTALANLIPNEQGIVELSTDVLAGKQFVQVLVVDPIHTTARSIALAETKTPLVDLRFAAGLNPDAHFSSQKRITVARPGQPFVVSDMTTSKVELYDSLARVFALYATLNADPKLAEFSFLLEWPDKKDEEKRTLYSKYACHELNVFLARKDPAFFATVVRPYLANKLAPKFVDQYLLERDLRPHVEPWQHGRLNIVERILLGERIADERPRTARHLADLLALVPPDIERFNRLFDTAVLRSALEANGELPVNLSMVISQTVDAVDAPAEPKPAAEDFAPATNQPRLYRNDKLNNYAFGMQAGRLGGVGGGAGGRAQNEMPKEEAKKLDDLRRSELRRDLKEVESLESRRLKFKSAELAGRDGKAQRAGSGENGRAVDANGIANAERTHWDRDADVDGLRLGEIRQFFRQLDATKEWAENDYYQLPIADQTAGLISVNAFWSDYAQRDPGQRFLSRHFAEASRNLSEILLALAVLDLPFQSPKHDVKVEATRMTIAPQSPLVIFHEEIQPAAAPAGPAKILVSQNFFALNDRYRQENGEQVDRFASDEFLVHTVYGGQIVVTNPTRVRQRLNLLVQIPRGALPVLNSRATKTAPIDLAPYNTTTIEYHFYFPAPGQFAHFPVHAAQGNDLIAFAAPAPFSVVEKPTRIDTQSWDYVSQHGTQEQVLELLDRLNVNALDLERIAWRMRDVKLFQAVIERLSRRHVYHDTLWSYSLLHNSVPAAREFLQHADELVAECGGRLSSPLLEIDPVARHAYQHLEYKPLANARAHVLGARRQIVNEAVLEQYHRFLKELAYVRTPSHADRLALTYYLLLQDRIDEALAAFAQVDANAVPTRMQYDYCDAYLAFFTQDTAKARAIATRYAQHPVDRWRTAFAAVIAQLDEIDGKGTATVDNEDRGQQQTQLAATEPSFELSMEGNELKIAYQNIPRVRVNYYEVDAELMFSRGPFAGQSQEQASFIRPSSGASVDLPAKDQTVKASLPEALRGRNLVIEVVGAGKTRSIAHYANTMTVQVIENYGQLRVTQQATGKPIPKAYVKVYSRTSDGEVKFYKDGYTDLRGRFDYASLSTDDLVTAERFALLIISDVHGSVVREATPPTARK